MFADDILNAKHGPVIDVVVNTLRGDLLNVLWRICADGGTLVNLGYWEVVNCNFHSVEPFDRIGPSESWTRCTSR